jgi:hypothetical protein
MTLREQNMVLQCLSKAINIMIQNKDADVEPIKSKRETCPAVKGRKIRIRVYLKRYYLANYIKKYSGIKNLKSLGHINRDEFKKDFKDILQGTLNDLGCPVRVVSVEYNLRREGKQKKYVKVILEI